MNKSKKIKLVNLQLITTSLFILTILVSLFLTYNKKNKILNKKYIKSKTVNNIYLINRIIVFFLLITYLYISYEEYKIGSDNKTEKQILLDELIASFVTIISGLIVLYDSYLNLKINTNDIENPEI